MANDKVTARLTELRNELAKPSIMSAQERLEWLTQLIMSKDESTTDKLRAADIMNKMQGEYTQKIEADVNNTVTINIELEDDDE
jgi:phage terminase small subunit